MLKYLALALGLAVLIVAPAVGAEQAFEARENGQIEFVMPSGNIGCLYTPEGGTDIYQPKDGGPELICERVEPTYVTVILGAESVPEIIEDPGEQACCGSANILEYGNTVTLDGAFRCISETSGLVCESINGGESDDDEDDAQADDGVESGDDVPGDADDDDDEEEDDSAPAAKHGFTMARAGIKLY